MIRIFITIAISASVLFFPGFSFSQGCCSGGSGSPIAGGASQGVLSDRQMELSGSFQYVQTNKYFAGSKDTTPQLKGFSSNYLYGRMAYGVTKNLTVSLEAGYFLNKQEINFNNDTAKSGGIADLIIFPHYDVYNHTEENKRIELTLGLGLKIPLGKYRDSTIAYKDSIMTIYSISPPTVQPTNGAHDFIFYAFFYRGFTNKNFRLFANGLYIKKGWNSLGEKFGDYASISLFAGKTIIKKLSITLQLKGEHIARTKAAQHVDLLGLYNVDTASTGSRKLFLVPQLSYSYKSFTLYCSGEFPLYQYVRKTQIASQHLFTFGIAYRFFTVKSKIPNTGENAYVCPMKCKGVKSNKPGKCPECGMELIKQE